MNDIYTTSSKNFIAYLMLREDVVFEGMDETPEKLIYKFSPFDVVAKVKNDFDEARETPVQAMEYATQLHKISGDLYKWRQKYKSNGGYKFYK